MNRRLSKGKCLLVPACILLIIAFIISGVLFASYKKAEAITSSNIDSLSTNIEEILIDGYEKNLNGRGYVFNKDIFWKLISQLSNNTVKDKNGLSTLGIKTSADFRSYNDNKDIVITIGGKKWIATYLSKNSDGEPILTLWLANDVKTSSWNESKTDLNGNYPANMYGTSSVRAITLNNGGGYAVNYNDTSLKSVAQDKENEWAIYTMSKDQGVQGSLTDFIEVPDKMSWQHTQSASASAGQSANYNNDALDVGGNGGIGSYLNKSGYKNWATDRLWLPSIAETGDSGISGIWQTSSFTRANDTSYTWVRSAHNDCYHQARLLNANGSGLNNGAGDYVVRPAFHLNLAKAFKYI